MKYITLTILLIILASSCTTSRYSCYTFDKGSQSIRLIDRSFEKQIAEAKKLERQNYCNSYAFKRKRINRKTGLRKY